MDFADFTIEVVANDGKTGVFKIGPLPRGFGHTVANSLRRVLLSSLPGAGITSFKISGIDHEYSTIKGIKENVLDIELNLKRIKFNCDSNEPQVVRLSEKGAKEVKASDLELTESVTVLNPDTIIATLTDSNSSIDMEIIVERGVGYKLGDEEVRSEVGRLPLDASFSPIERVNFRVDETRKGEMMNLDMVTMTIFSDGSVDPKDALGSCAEKLTKMFTRIIDILSFEPKEIDKQIEKVETSEEEKVSETEDVSSNDIKALFVEDLPVSKRAKSSMIDAGIKTVGDIVEKSSEELLNLSGFGDKALSEVKELINGYGLKLRE
ncbi:DNA-directed RNA polymerase subunit alpha [Candidatus Dojkabacteria bacterium]|nr:DNA-directed RNA polymerase subunit alpha [Candidatus Dojkabacteria bacterium]